MSALPLGEQERADALVLSALLRTGVHLLGWWSLGMLLLTIAMGLASPATFGETCLWGLVLLWGVFAQYLLFRLVFDAFLFYQLGHGHMANLMLLDTALARLGLRTKSLPERAWIDRLRGARGLLLRYAFVVLLQTVAVFGVLIFQGIL